MRPLYLTGISLWSPGYRDLAAFVDDARDASVTDCSARWVPPRLARGTSRLTRMLGEAAAAACEAGGADPRTVATIYTSGYGEIETMIVQLQTIFAGDGQLSPMRFKNSVHNSASGLGSIGQGNQGFSTAIAAGDRSVEAALIETWTLLDERGGDAVISAADDALPAPLDAQCAREGLAIGLCLASEQPARGALAILDGLRMDDEALPLPDAFRGRALSRELATNPVATVLPLIDAVLERREGRVPLAFGVARPWSMHVRPLAPVRT
ncbi:beta-ketoacyl synthase chain length factor [Sandaracinus amylolyticus]|uniref:3-oxoacyl-[ACP] synthase n=1 Tax=Sandaracinus amylolyticus TaxID=927083 RepID=A0A0F6WA00_9BACT|nr:beta-ketoacyl synthase chain length factor [Sandaracinus amylolyticus]AKF11192.1 3-oxoacyl-[ACP] synthase [Sandaracinus amylolyticus]